MASQLVARAAATSGAAVAAAGYAYFRELASEDDAPPASTSEGPSRSAPRAVFDAREPPSPSTRPPATPSPPRADDAPSSPASSWDVVSEPSSASTGPDGARQEGGLGSAEGSPEPNADANADADARVERSGDEESVASDVSPPSTAASVAIGGDGDAARARLSSSAFDSDDDDDASSFFLSDDDDVRAHADDDGASDSADATRTMRRFERAMRRRVPHERSPWHEDDAGSNPSSGRFATDLSASAERAIQRRSIRRCESTSSATGSTTSSAPDSAPYSAPCSAPTRRHRRRRVERVKAELRRIARGADDPEATRARVASLLRRVDARERRPASEQGAHQGAQQGAQQGANSKGAESSSAGGLASWSDEFRSWSSAASAAARWLDERRDVVVDGALVACVAAGVVAALGTVAPKIATAMWRRDAVPHRAFLPEVFQ